MPSATPTPKPGIANPWGTYAVQPTEHGIRFQINARDPRNNTLLAVLIAVSLALPLLTCTGFWSFLALLVQLLILNAALYFCLAGTQLISIEVRPDGIVIRPKIDDENSEQFFDRRSITNRHIDYDAGLTFRYGIYDIRATPGFANIREAEILELHLEQTIARLWHQENLDE